jgi:hypothetical protein
LFVEIFDVDQAIQPESFRHFSKRYYYQLSKGSYNTQYWDTKVSIPPQQWKDCFHSLSKLHNHSHSDVNELFELQTGMMNRQFYHPCPFCRGSGGTYHVFFACLGINDILTEIGINTNISSLIGSTFSKKEAYNGNFIVNLIIFYNKQIYKNNKNDPDFRITGQFIKNTYSLFKFERFSSF